MASSSTTNPPTTTKFTPEMQDRQARNKDPYTGKVPYNSASDEEGGGSSSSSVTPQPRKTPKFISAADDAFESRENRRWAATILNIPELVQLHAISRNDSVPGTRHHFTKILCGYDNPPRASEKRAAAAKKEKEKKPVSKVHYKPFTGAFEL